MVRESVKNFATSALSGAITASSTTIGLTGGSGGNFPSVGPFVIGIDTELILIASRATDTLTVASGGRGFDGTTAASHNLATTVQLPICAYNIDHIWANLADTFNPAVPPIQMPLSASGVPTGSAGTADNEMETQGSWTINPSGGGIPGDATWNIGTTVPSNALLSRGATDSNLYTAYASFTPGSSTQFTVTCKVSTCLNMIQQGVQESDFHLFVSDQSTPSSGASVGNMMKLIIADTSTIVSGTLSTNARTLRAVKVVTGTATSLNSQMVVPYGLPLYLRINYDGAGKWRTFFGDGISYSLISDLSGLSFAPATIGFHCSVSNTTSSQIVLVDFMRTLTGTRLQFWG